MIAIAEASGLDIGEYVQRLRTLENSTDQFGADSGAGRSDRDVWPAGVVRSTAHPLGVRG